MKRGKSRRNPLTGQSNKNPIHIRDRRIIPVNDAPLRKGAATDCKRAMAKLDKARAEWRRFEQEDRPAFGRWMASTLGALLSELRENARVIDEQEGLIEEVEMEMMWGSHRNPRKAYAAAMKRRENPVPDDDSADDDDPASGGDAKDADDFSPFEEMGADIPKEERQAMFEDFVRSILGINPKRMNKAEYAKMFAQFEADMFGSGSEGNPFQVHDEERRSPSRDEARLKEIYRILVRRLHPDLRADGDAQVSAIWHEVQEAYEARNLDRLETLLALTEMQNGTNGGQASISQMQAALAELKRALRAIQRSIRGAKSDPAWGFTKMDNPSALEKRIRRELEESIREQQRVRADFKRTLDAWSRPLHPPAKNAKKQPKPPIKAKAERLKPASDIPAPVQTEFCAF